MQEKLFNLRMEAKQLREQNSIKPVDMHKIAETALRKYLLLSEELQKLSNHVERFKKVFTTKQMNALKKYLTEIDLKFFGMTKEQCKRLVYEFAERIGVDHPFNRGTRMVSDNWLNNFMRDFNFTIRPQESVQSSLGAGCNQKDTDCFFWILLHLRKNFDFLPEKIYHADEICISAVPNDLTRYISSSQVKSRGSSRMLVETRENVTLVCCANAVGSYIPPMIVFPRDKMIPGFLRGLPPGSIGYTSEKGLINSELFLTFLKHFIQHASPSKRTPVLLLIDNYISYISLEAMDFCKANNVVMMGFPPNSRQKLQPLDISFFGPLKACYSHACDGFSDAYPRVKLTVDNVGEVFRNAYCRTATPENAIKGFQDSGIEPFKPHLFCTVDTFEDKKLEGIRLPEVKNVPAEDSDVEIITWQDGTGFLEPAKKDSLSGTVEGDGESIACLRCSRLFPTKDWVQCPFCKQWWHRDCDGYHKGVHCDHCKSIWLTKDQSKLKFTM